MARESEFTEEIGESICESISQGDTVIVAANAVGFEPRTVYKWLARNPAFVQQYARAGLIRAYSRFERIDQVMLDMRAGVIDAAQARVEIDAIKWQCGKEAPAKYGDRLELAGQVDTSQGWATILRERRAKRAKVKDAPSE